MRAIDPDLERIKLRKLDAWVSQSLGDRRFPALLTGLFAAIGLALTALGLYGAIALEVGNTGDSFLALIDPSGATWNFSSYIDTMILGLTPLSSGDLWLASTGFTGTLNFGPPPATPTGTPLILAVYNAASFHLSDTIAPGEVVTIFGEELAPAAQQALIYPLPPSLLGVSVTVGGIAAPLYYVSSGQINFQVPYGVPLGSAVLAVTRGAQAGQRTLTLAASSPGIFTASGDGSSQPLVVHASDFSPVTQAHPAHAGEYLAVFCTGLGATSPPAIEGHAAAAAPIQANYSVNVDSRLANATPYDYAGLTAGYAGLYQVNFQLFADQPAGMTIFSIQVGLNNSQEVPVWVQ